MNLKRKKLIIIVSIFIVSCMIALIVFVFPNPNSYLLEINSDGDNKKGYTLYQTLTISNEIKSIDFVNHRLEGVDELDINQIRFGSPAYFVVIDQYAYRFYRLSKETTVLVTKSHINSDYDIEQYALISKNSYQKIASFSHYTKYEDLNYWD